MLALEPGLGSVGDTAYRYASITHPPTPIPYKVARTNVWAAAVSRRSVWERILDRPDCREFVRLQLEELRPNLVLANQIPPWVVIPTKYRAATVVDTHNAEGLRLSRRLCQSPWWEGPLLHQQRDATVRFESTVSREAAIVWAVSGTDVSYFQRLGARCELIPNGVDMPQHAWHMRGDAVTEQRPVRLLFLGSFDYHANVDALNFFVQDWARWADDLPWRIDVVGSGDVSNLSRRARTSPRTTLLGRVQDVGKAYLTHDALIVPMRLGGGTRLKVLEGFAHGIPVISTRVGVEGVGAEPGRHFLPAEKGADFREALVALITDRERPLRLSSAARELASSFQWSSVGARADASIGRLIDHEG